jgi:hypothetical protein
VGTENRHVVKATGKVEAGFDLSKARIGLTGPNDVVVILPPVHYKVTIEGAQAVESRGALFWRNENGNLEAVDQARASFLESAAGSNLRKEALTNAEKLLQDLLAPFGVQQVEVRVQDISSRA